MSHGWADNVAQSSVNGAPLLKASNLFSDNGDSVESAYSENFVD